MTKLSKYAAKITVPALMLALSCGMADAAERVAMASPAKDAAMVPVLRGMVNNLKAKTFMDEARTANDGIVIRQSRIENGKIIIPAGGLYVTSRSGNWEPFRGDVLTIAGKEYYSVMDRYERNIVRNITAKVGQLIPINDQKTRGFQITGVSDNSLGMTGAGNATFMLVKATGNFYGSSFPVYAGNLLTNIATSNMDRMTTEPEGTTVPTAENKLDRHAYGSNFFSVGRTHVIIDPANINKDAIKVLELGTDSCTDLWVSPNQPVVGEYAKGGNFTIGSTKVEITALGQNSATVKVTDGKGSVEKELGPYAKNEWEPMSMSGREPFWMLSSDGKTAVMLHVRKDGGPFAAGKVSLVAFNDLVHIQNSSVWEADNRFVAIPET